MRRSFVIALAAFLILIIGVIWTQKTRIVYYLKRDSLNVLLISIDTLRADRLGCYGFREIETPNIDRICKEGIKFENCVAQVPLTLPSHTTILSGTYPFYHNIRDNGGFIVPEELVTLPEILKQHGFVTAAIIGAYVLDSKWGLNQGFDYYYDNFDLSKYKRISLSSVERKAEEVVKHAIEWLDRNWQKRFFLWVHVYDPHAPYEPPPPFDREYAGRPYAGEVAYTDHELGKLFEYLREKKLIDRTLIVIVSDHGESLGQHGEQTHGYFVYEPTMRVVLIIRAPIKGLMGKVVRARVGLVDVAPTILDFLGYEIPNFMQGESLVKFLFNPNREDERPVYGESFYPRFHFGWNELRTIYWKNYKFIETTKPELYDLEKDPQERENLYLKKPLVVKRMRRMLKQLERSVEGKSLDVNFMEMDEEARVKLAALGYVSTFTDTKRKGRLPDPKDNIAVFNKIIEARGLTKRGKLDEAIKILEEVVTEQPDIVDANFTLGNLYYKKKEYKKALYYFKKVLRLKPDYNFAMLNILNCYRFMGEVDRGIKEAEAFIKVFPRHSEFYLILGNFYLDKKEYDRAEENFKKAWEVGKNAFALRDLGVLYLMKGDPEKAESYLRRSIKEKPDIKMAHYHLALIEEERGNMWRAVEEYEKEIEVNPDNFKAHFNVARLYRELGEREKQIEHLEKVVEIVPDFQIGLLYLAKAYLDSGIELDKAINLAKKGIKMDPKSEYAVFGYYILSDIYALLGDKEESDRFFKMGNKLRTYLQIK